MTKVFVHGVPETEDVWSQLHDALIDLGVPATDMVMLSPPGFGSPVPDGWVPSRLAYLNWLIAEVEKLDGPVDLVAHDWGAGHVFGLASARADLVRSWAADCAGLVHPGYEWHEAAATWRTLGAGEEAMTAMVDLPMIERCWAYAGLGLPEEVAVAMGEAFDRSMADCILGLYRSAPESELRAVGDELNWADPRPSLVIAPTEDAYVPHEHSVATAGRMKIPILELAGHGHWWMTSAPEQAAVGLAEFWAAIH